MCVNYEEIMRYRVEDHEYWKKWAEELPSLRFDSDWEVRIIPPFGGAISRFAIKKGERFISVYFDALARLGFMYDANDKPIPYWEVYTTSIEGEEYPYPHRYLLGEEEELMKDIRRILND